MRGEPGVKDEPQHIKQGKVTLPLLEAMGIKYTVLSQDEKEFLSQLSHAASYMDETREPFAFVIQKGTFEEYKLRRNEDTILPLKRETAIQLIASSLANDNVVVSTTGMISRELFEYRASVSMGHERDFLTVGSMGHASQIALGIALEKKNRRIYCFDGDGATLMHMGSLAITGSLHPANYVHIVFNNGAHDSVGGQPTVAFDVDLCKIAQACGYEIALSVSDSESLRETLERMKQMRGPILLEVKVRKGAREDLGRPTTTPVQNKEAFMLFLDSE